MENYNHKLVEKKWQKFWKENKTFEFKKDKNRKSYYTLSMFLYPSGDMHLGHLKNYSICDVNARFKRLQGFNVLHPTGADAFGLPAENAAIKKGIHPSEWTYQNLAKIIESMEKCGLSLDTTKTFATCDEDYQGFQQQIFIDMYKKGLIYRKESYVNWDPVDKTVLANDQVINGRGWRSDALVERKKMTQWFVKITNYAEELLQGIKNGDLNGWPEKVRLMQENWIGKSEGALVKFNISNTEKNIVELHCQKPYFDYLKSGIKTIEGRKNSPKYQNLKVGDIIKFYCNEESFYCKITQIDKFKNLKEYLENNDLSNILPNAKNIEEGEKIYRSFSDDIDNYEFLGIHVEKINIFDFIEVYTTRPDTLFGASFIGLSADHPITQELAKNNKEIANFVEECKKTTVDEKTIETMEKKGIFTGLYVEHPFDKNWKLPVWIANFILMDYGTGAIFACPAHDQRDYEFATKYNLPIKVVVSPDGKDFSLQGQAYEETGIAVNSEFLNGLTTNEAKQKATEKIEELGIGEKKVNFRLRDWCISRQRYWGCPIPMVYCEHCGIVPATDLPVKLPKDVIFDGKGNPLANHPTWKNTVCPVCGKPAIRETDTMDTFMDSSWYFMRFIDLCKDKPINTELCNELLPIEQYTGGIEHATGHLIFARFLTKVMSDLGYLDKNIREPAKKLFNQGMLMHKAYKNKKGDWIHPSVVKEENGKYFNIETNEELDYQGIIKMSKSKLNVVDVSQILEDYGADACRLYVLSDTPAEKESEWTAEGIEGCWKFINRMWRTIINFINENDIEKLKTIKINLVNEIVKEQHKTIKDTTEYLENLQFNKAIAKLREFFNIVDKFIPQNDEEKAIKFGAIVDFIKMISPFTPHICEELNMLLKNKENLDKKGWPEFKEELTIDTEIEIAIQVNGKLRGTIKIKKDANKEEIETIAKNEENTKRHLEGKEIKKVIVVPNKLINFVAV